MAGAAGAAAAASAAGAEILPSGWSAAPRTAETAAAAAATRTIDMLERVILKQDKIGKFLFPGGVAGTSLGTRLKSSHMFFGVTKLNGEDTFPYYDKYNFSKPEYEGEFEFEKYFIEHLEKNCLSLINTGFMFDIGHLTLDSLKDINKGVYSTNDKSEGTYKSTYLCHLLVTGSDSIPILVSTGILVITKDNIGHLWSFVTNPAYSGKGYGTKFLEHVKNLLFTHGIKILRLIVSNSNYPFMSFEQRLLFYSKNGFKIFSQNGKDNIKFITPDRKEHTLKLIAPLSSTSSSKSGCTLFYNTKIDEKVVQHTHSVSYDYLKKNTIISVINPKNEIIGQCDIKSEVLGVPPKPIDQKTMYSSPPGRLYSCLFHGEILSKSFNQGTIKTFKVPSNVELIVVNQIGSALYAYQWFYFLHIYNYYGFSAIPIEILKFIFPNIRTEDIRYAKRNPDGSIGETVEKEIIIPSLIKDFSHLINASKKRSGSIAFHGTGDEVRDDSFTVSAYGPGDVCPNLALSMTIHTNAGRNWKIYDMALREGGLRVSKDGKNLYVPSRDYSTDKDKMLSSDRVWPEPKNIENYTDMTEHPEKIDPGRFIKPTETLETMVKKAITHTILNTTREDVDEDVENIRIVVGCCAGLYRNYSPTLLKHLQQAMFVPGYDTLKRVQYTSHRHLITLLKSFGERINSFTRSISSGSLLNMDVRGSKYSDVRDIMLKRLHHYLAGTHNHSSISPIGRAPMSRKTRRNKKRNKNKTKRKHLNKHTS
jgi:GNAT superfamily N-acetyltransferase